MPQLLQLLDEVDSQLANTALDDELFAALQVLEIHRAHGVAGRIQDRVIAILSRLTMEMANRDDDEEGVPGTIS